MKIALLSPIAWRTPPLHYGPWETIVSMLAEGLTQKGLDVTLFATGDSYTSGHLEWICPHAYEEDQNLDPKVWECLHIAHLFEKADKYDIIHNNYDFLPLSYSRLVKTPLVTTIHGFSSPRIIPVYRRYNDHTHYVSISYADRHPELQYIANIYHGIELDKFTYQPESGSYLLYFGRIHRDKGTAEAIEIARRSGMPLLIAGIIQDQDYYDRYVAPHLEEEKIVYLGSVGPEQRNKLLGGAYALLHPINFNEPFGLSVIEAQACGTPVIAFPRGSMREVIQDGSSGFLVEDIDAAVNRLENISLLRRSDCRRWVENNFSQEHMIEEYIKVYQKILDQEKPS